MKHPVLYSMKTRGKQNYGISDTFEKNLFRATDEIHAMQTAVKLYLEKSFWRILCGSISQAITMVFKIRNSLLREFRSSSSSS